MPPFLKEINWRIFGILLGAGLAGVVAVLPYVADMVGSLPFDEAAVPDMPWPMVAALALLQNGLLLAVAIAIGLVMSERIGLRMPLIRAWGRSGARMPNAKAILLPGMIVGAAVGAVLVGIEAMFFLRHLPSSMLPQFDIPLWKRLLAGVLYGGITEELLMRLFLLSTVAWLLGRWWKTAEAIPTPGAFWTAIALTAILFGVGHLPATALISGALTPTLIVRALVLNGVAGVAFGYLYWRYGLEAAMAGHMGAHLVMQVPGVMLLRTML